MNQPNFLHKHSSPVLIGGVGGSGTRLITQCMKEAGYFMGSDLNHANDNLWFTLLFKRIDILFSSEEEFDMLLRIMLNGMTGAREFTRQQIDLIAALASKDRAQCPASWLSQRATTLLSKKPEIKLDARWGWKEPNTHIVLDQLKDRLENMKYIHVTRNGLDMAHSNNQTQLRLWGRHFIRKSFNISPYYSLKYWCIVHQRVLNIGKSMHANFLFLNYDDFCLNPENGIKQLCEFLGLEADNLMPLLVDLIRPPDSTCQLHKLSARERFRFIKSGIFGTKWRVA